MIFKTKIKSMHCYKWHEIQVETKPQSSRETGIVVPLLEDNKS